MSTKSITDINNLMQKYIDAGKTAGMVTLVSQHGKIVHRQTGGFQDMDSQTPMSFDTLFRIYSMTKPITSVALMTLYEKGFFELDDPACKWIPALKNLKVYRDNGRYEDLDTPITIRQLLTHTGGFSYGFDPENQPVDKLYGEVWQAINQDRPLAEVLQLVFEQPLFAQPGSRWQYSVATDICGFLVELMSDMPFGDYLQKTIFDPLEMHDTGFEVKDQQRHRLASLYGISDDAPLTKLDVEDSALYLPSAKPGKAVFQSGGGGLLSTVDDYWQFAQMMLNGGEYSDGRIIKQETVKLMTQNHVPEELFPLSFNGIIPDIVSGYGFGLGYCINMGADQVGSVGDYGWGGMADTYCWIDPKEEIVGILMQQFFPSLTYSSRLDFRKAVYHALR